MKTLYRSLASLLLLGLAAPAWAGGQITAPTQLHAIGLDKKIEVHFTPGVSDNCGTITNYLYSTNNSNYVELNPATTTSPISFTLESVAGRPPLTNGNTYQVSLTAKSAACTGSDSTAIAVTPNPTVALPIAWGSNASSQLGLGAVSSAPTPANVLTSGALKDKIVTQVSAGHNHSCAVASGKAYCWGNDSSGQLGNGIGGTSNEPGAVDDSGELAGKTIVQISAAGSASGSHTCAVDSLGDAYCWGNGTGGKLGIGSQTNQESPVKVAKDTALNNLTVTAISAGPDHTCAIANATGETGRAYCWGSGFNGKLGNSNTTNQTKPVAVQAAATTVLFGKTVTAISVGSQHSCAVADGKAFCWGNDGSGQLGNGNSSGNSNVPVAVVANPGEALSGKTVTAISAAGGNIGAHTCAIADGQAFCWGSPASGRLGNNNASTDQQSPVAVRAEDGDALFGKTVSAISAGAEHSCAVASGQAFCWGSGGSFQLGNGSSSSNLLLPTAVSVAGTSVAANRIITAISAGNVHTLALSLATVPANPRGLTAATAGSGELSISFTAPSDGGSPITNYEYSVGTGAFTALNPADTTSPVTVTGLTNDVLASVRLRAVNAAGSGATSGAVTGMPVNPIANGVCGSASSPTVGTATAPTGTAACSSGVLATVGVIGNSNGKWNWTCDGVGGGNNTALLACSAPYASQAITELDYSPKPVKVGDSAFISYDDDGKSGNAVTYSTTSTNCTVNSAAATASLTAPGTCTVKANQLGTGDTGASRYLAAPEASLDINVLYNEANVPSGGTGGGTGDGNGDTIQDSTQANVNTVATGNSVVTVETDAGTTLMSISAVALPTDLPPGTNAAATAVAFTVTGVTTPSVTIELFFPVEDKVVSLLKQNLITGEYVTVDSTPVVVGNKTLFSFSITDNDPNFDSNMTTGVISDPVIPVIGGGGGKGKNDDGFLGLGAVNPLMLVLLGLLGLRRRKLA